MVKRFCDWSACVQHYILADWSRWCTVCDKGYVGLCSDGACTNNVSLASRYFSRLCRRRRHLNITSSRTRSCLQRIGCHHMVTFTAAQLNDYTSIASSFTTHCRLSLEPLPFLHHPIRASGGYSYYHHHPTAPHCTQFALYLSTPASFGYKSASAAASGGRTANM